MNADLTGGATSPCLADREVRSGQPSGGEAAALSLDPAFRELERAVAEAGSDTALVLLWKAYRYAQDAGRDAWDFALEIDTLIKSGVTSTDLRWLVAKGFVEHGREVGGGGAGNRSFCPSVGFHFLPDTCLVLTSLGARHVRGVLQGILVSSPILLSVSDVDAGQTEVGLGGGGEGARESWEALSPCWNAARRELVWGARLVKRFRVPAPNQERILCAFEEEAWPARIDDPLPLSKDIDPHTRLHDAINRLNRHQQIPLLGFHGDGTGTGVFWEFRQPGPGS